MPVANVEPAPGVPATQPGVAQVGRSEPWEPRARHWASQPCERRLAVRGSHHLEPLSHSQCRMLLNLGSRVALPAEVMVLSASDRNGVPHRIQRFESTVKKA